MCFIVSAVWFVVLALPLWFWLEEKTVETTQTLSETLVILIVGLLCLCSRSLSLYTRSLLTRDSCCQDASWQDTLKSLQVCKFYECMCVASDAWVSSAERESGVCVSERERGRA